MASHLFFFLDHENGFNKDNRIQNLRLICPNCDSQLDTSKGKNNKTKKHRKKNENGWYSKPPDGPTHYGEFVNMNLTIGLKVT